MGLLKSQVLNCFKREIEHYMQQIFLNENKPDELSMNLFMTNSNIIYNINLLNNYTENIWKRVLQYLKLQNITYSYITKLKKYDCLIRKKYKVIKRNSYYQRENLELKMKNNYVNIVKSFILVKKLYSDVFETNFINKNANLKDIIDEHVSIASELFNYYLYRAIGYDNHGILKVLASNQKYNLSVCCIGVFNSKFLFKINTPESNYKNTEENANKEVDINVKQNLILEENKNTEENANKEVVINLGKNQILAEKNILKENKNMEEIAGMNTAEILETFKGSETFTSLEFINFKL